MRVRAGFRRNNPYLSGLLRVRAGFRRNVSYLSGLLRRRDGSGRNNPYLSELLWAMTAVEVSQPRDMRSALLAARHTLTDVTDVPPELAELRSSIDNIDAALIHLLAERFKATQRVGVLKAEWRMPPADPAREEVQIARLRALAKEAGLDPIFAEKFLAFVVAEVIRHHEAIAETAEVAPTASP